MKMRLRELFVKMRSRLPKPKFTRFTDLSLFEWMNQNAVGKKVLNLGSGVGNFDHYLSQDLEMLNIDIDQSMANVSVVADAHFLPFRSGCFAVVYSIAMLEHVEKPWLVAEEITRVLQSGGYVVLEVPFLNVIHDKNDYFRFTDKGIRSLFNEENYEVILERVGSGGGSFLSVFLFAYLEQFLHSKYLKAMWGLGAGYLMSWIKYLDILAPISADLKKTANSFSFVGKKR